MPLGPRQKWRRAPALRPLTFQQQRFVEQYLIHGNGKQAAIAAGFSPRSAAARAVALKHLPHVAEAIRKGRATQAEDARIEAARVLAELGRVAFSDIGRIAEWDGEGMALKSNAEIAPADRAAIAELAGPGQRSGARVRLHNKQRALDSIARHLGLYGRGSGNGFADPAVREDAAERARRAMAERHALAESAREKLRQAIERYAAEQEKEVEGVDGRVKPGHDDGG